MPAAPDREGPRRRDHRARPRARDRAVTRGAGRDRRRHRRGGRQHRPDRAPGPVSGARVRVPCHAERIRWRCAGYLGEGAAMHRLDIAIQPEGLGRRAKRLVVLDVDSTLIQDEVIELLAAEAGCLERVRELTDEAMAGELDFESALRQRVRAARGPRPRCARPGTGRDAADPRRADLRPDAQTARLHRRHRLGRLHPLHRPAGATSSSSTTPWPTSSRSSTVGSPDEVSGRRSSTAHARPSCWPSSPRPRASRCHRPWRSATAPTTWTCCRPPGSASRSTPSRWCRRQRTRPSTCPTSTRSCSCSGVTRDEVERADTGDRLTAAGRPASRTRCQRGQSARDSRSPGPTSDSTRGPPSTVRRDPRDLVQVDRLDPLQVLGQRA